MTCHLEDPPGKTGRSAAPPLVLDIALIPGDHAAPLRVLSLLARRRCRLQRAAFTLSAESGGPQLRVELAAPAGREATVVRWVAGLVSVRRVDRVVLDATSTSCILDTNCG